MIKQTDSGTESQTSTKSSLFVVTRDGFRVSSNDYEDPKDPIAVAEKDFWKKISKKHSHNELVTITKYDPKLHRVWSVDES